MLSLQVDLSGLSHVQRDSVQVLSRLLLCISFEVGKNLILEVVLLPVGRSVRGGGADCTLKTDWSPSLLNWLFW